MKSPIKTHYVMAIGYSLILAVVLMSVFLSHEKLARLETNVARIQTNYMPSVEALGRMGIVASSIQRYLYQLTAERDKPGFEDARRQSLDLMTEVHSRQLIYNTRYVSDLEEQELFSQVIAAWDGYLPRAKTIASDPASVQWDDTARMGQIMQSWQQVDKDIMNLIEYKAAIAGLAASASVELVDEVKRQFTLGAFMAATIVAGVWIFTARIVSRSEQSIKQTIAELKRTTDELTASRDTVFKLAYYDSLTGLPNQAQFAAELADMLEKGQAGLLWYIDLDNFKFVNDSYGHQWGDRLLVAFARRIESLLPQGAIFCRLGGDEFTVVLPGTTAAQAGLFAGTILDALREPFLIHNTRFFASASMGVVCFPDQGTEVSELLRKADVAMYKAKEAGRNGFCLFDPAMDVALADRLALENSLRDAIAKRELYLSYQPIVTAADCTLVGFEALLRWNSGEHGMVAPNRFIPLAESSGLIITIGEWVLQEACAFIKQVHAIGYKQVKISVNLSVKQLTSSDIVATVQKVLEHNQLDTRLLELEITETLLMDSSAATLKRIMQLAKLGVSIALDDFGTGYSSLTYLRKLPIRTLKLDKAFLDNITSTDDAAPRAIVNGLIKIAQEMGLGIVAEGVETAEQLAYLQQHKCPYVQGYLINRPMPGEDCIRWLELHKNQ